jgi:hypothetical protein
MTTTTKQKPRSARVPRQRTRRVSNRNELRPRSGLQFKISDVAMGKLPMTSLMPPVPPANRSKDRSHLRERFRLAGRRGQHDATAVDKKTFKKFLAPLRRIKWVVYCKDPFGGPEQVLRYLSRYTHRIAISNRRLVAADNGGVSFRWKDYRIEGPGRWKTMTLTPHEFIRRFLMHVLPRGFHRIRHYGLFANNNRAASIARARELLAVPARSEQPDTPEAPAADEPRMLPRPCPCCGGRMFIIETFARGCQPKHRPTPAPATIRIDTS